MRASAALMLACACAALSLLSPVQSLEYYTGTYISPGIEMGPGSTYVTAISRKGTFHHLKLLSPERYAAPSMRPYGAMRP